MFDYLQQFNNLPREIRDKVSSPQAMAVLSDLENKYKVDLAMLVMKVMIKSISPNNLTTYFISELSLNIEQAENLSKELKEKIFHSVAEYLGLSAEVRALDLDKDINLLIKEAGLVLASDNLISRLKNILATYLRGVRSKIDAKESLMKDVKIGGLGLSLIEVERLFKVCDKSKFNNLAIANSLSSAPAPLSRLDKIVSNSLKTNSQFEEYSLKQALEKGETKSVEKDRNFVETTAPKERVEANQIKEKIDLSKFEKKINLPKLAEQKNLPEFEVQKKFPKFEEQKDLPRPESKLNLPQGEQRAIISVPPLTPPKSNIQAEVKKAIVETDVIKPVVATSAQSNPLQTISKPVAELGLWSKLFRKPVSNIKKDKTIIKDENTSKAELNSLVAQMNQAAIVRAKAMQTVKQNTTNTPRIPNTSSAPIATVKPIISATPITPKMSVSATLHNIPTASSILPSAVPHRQAPTPSSSRPHVRDIKPMPKVMGPIEELQFLDLVNFRRLGKTPEEISAKIFSKIQLLERDGYDKMIQGIKAWRQSPVNRLYLQMVFEALKKGMTVKDFVLASEQEKKEGLSFIEIETIINLNSKLIF